MDGRRLQVSKKNLTDRQMSDVAYIDQAVTWSKELTRMRARGPGDLENAMRSIERDYGIDYWLLWQLRYRRDRFKDIGCGVFARLREAWFSECARQQRKLAIEIEITKAIAGPDCPAVVAAEALVRTNDE